MNPASNTKTREIIAALAVLLVVTVIVITAAATNPSKTVSKPKQASNVQLSATKAAAGSMYKNGMFTATGSYDSPGGPEDFTLKLTLKDDVITDTSAISGSKDDTSRIYQQQFIGGYKQLIIGKKINEVKLGVVSGSSLTTQGFTKALNQIEQEAVQS